MTTQKENNVDDVALTILVTQLQAEDPSAAGLLLSGLVGGIMSSSLAALIARLKEEAIWAPLLKYYNEKNKFFEQLLIENLASQQTEDEDKNDGMRM